MTAEKTEAKELQAEKEEVTELQENALDDIAGGVQAGLITIGGSGEFGPKKPEQPKPRKPYL